VLAARAGSRLALPATCATGTVHRARASAQVKQHAVYQSPVGQQREGSRAGLNVFLLMRSMLLNADVMMMAADLMDNPACIITFFTYIAQPKNKILCRIILK
jgi:hypothetical protein